MPAFGFSSRRGRTSVVACARCPTLEANRILADEPPRLWVLVPGPVVVEPDLGIPLSACEGFVPIAGRQEGVPLAVEKGRSGGGDEARGSASARAGIVSQVYRSVCRVRLRVRSRGWAFSRTSARSFGRTRV
jgi:hypothetical protein